MGNDNPSMRKAFNYLLFSKYNIKYTMLKNAMLFTLAFLSLSGCANYSRPENVAVKNSVSNYPPPTIHRRKNSSRRIPIAL